MAQDVMHYVTLLVKSIPIKSQLMSLDMSTEALWRPFTQYQTHMDQTDFVVLIRMRSTWFFELIKFFFKETAWSELHRNEVLLQKMTTIQHSLFKGSVWTRLYQWDDVDTSLYIVAYVFGILPACMNAASLVSFDTEIPLKACCFWMCYWYA